MGDLNYRLSKLPPRGYPSEGKASDDIPALEEERLDMVQNDTLRREQREGRAFGGLREGDLSRFAPTYKRIVGQVDGYSRYVVNLLWVEKSYPNICLGNDYLGTPTVYSSHRSRILLCCSRRSPRSRQHLPLCPHQQRKSAISPRRQKPRSPTTSQYTQYSSCHQRRTTRKHPISHLFCPRLRLHTASDPSRRLPSS